MPFTQYIGTLMYELKIEFLYRKQVKVEMTHLSLLGLTWTPSLSYVNPKSGPTQIRSTTFYGLSAHSVYDIKISKTKKPLQLHILNHEKYILVMNPMRLHRVTMLIYKHP